MKTEEGAAPVVVLDHPQMGENIGAAIRAMMNCGLDRLRLVAPRDGWPDERAERMAAGALAKMRDVEVFDTLPEAVADCTAVYATTARQRDMVKRVFTPEGAAADIRARAAAGHACALVFGGERAGLDNDAVAAAHAVVTVPLNPAFTSLNLGQAVLLVGYAWHAAGNRTPPAVLERGEALPATSQELDGFLDRLETALEAGHFFRSPEMRPHMRRNIRNLFMRAEATDQEVRTLHGILSALTGQREPR